MKNLIYFLFALISSIESFSQYPELEWVKQLGGTGTDRGVAVATDPSGNIYSTGYYEMTGDFEPRNYVTKLKAEDKIGIFISKTNTDGKLIWSKHFDGIPNIQSFSIASDDSGNVYTIGKFSDTVDFDLSKNEYSLYATNGVTFVLKLNTKGEFVFVKQFPMYYGTSITLDSKNNIYCIGKIQGSNSQMGGYEPTDDDFQESKVILKLDSRGDLIWQKQINCSYSFAHVLGNSIVVDNAGGVYVVGTFYDIIDANVGPEQLYMKTNRGHSEDIFILKLDNQGDFAWAKHFGSNNSDWVNSIAIDSNNDIIVAGNFRETVNFGDESEPVNLSSKGSGTFILKLNQLGKLVWVKQIEGRCETYSMITDKSGNIYATGGYSSSTDFDPGPDIDSLSAPHGNFISKLDKNGQHVWVIHVVSSSTGHGCANGISVDAFNNVFAIGQFSNQCDFDPSADSLILTSHFYKSDGYYSNDIFIAKLSQPK